jgi:small subunit ribosomal protein S20
LKEVRDLANHMQAKKRARQTVKRATRNQHIRTTLRTYVKRVRTTLAEANGEAAEEALKIAVKHIDRSVTKGILHRRTASRIISRLTVAVNKL